MGEGLLSTGPAALLGVGRESGRKEIERGRGSCLDCASLSRATNYRSSSSTSECSSLEKFKKRTDAYFLEILEQKF